MSLIVASETRSNDNKALLEFKLVAYSRVMPDKFILSALELLNKLVVGLVKINLVNPEPSPIIVVYDGRVIALATM
jgi:hypothetical protein